MHNEITLDVLNTQVLLQTSRVSGVVPRPEVPVYSKVEDHHLTGFSPGFGWLDN